MPISWPHGKGVAGGLGGSGSTWKSPRRRTPSSGASLLPQLSATLPSWSLLLYPPYLGGRMASRAAGLVVGPLPTALVSDTWYQNVLW